MPLGRTRVKKMGIRRGKGGNMEAMTMSFEDENEERGRLMKTEFLLEQSFQDKNINTG